jgi:hypothetical protein
VRALALILLTALPVAMAADEAAERMERAKRSADSPLRFIIKAGAQKAAAKKPAPRASAVVADAAASDATAARRAMRAAEAASAVPAAVASDPASVPR